MTYPPEYDISGKSNDEILQFLEESDDDVVYLSDPTCARDSDIQKLKAMTSRIIGKYEERITLAENGVALRRNVYPCQKSVVAE